MFMLSILSAKEGMAKGLTAKVGCTIIDTILKTTDGSNYSKIDYYSFHELLQAVFEGAEC